MMMVSHKALWAVVCISAAFASQASAKSWCTTGDLSGSYVVSGSRLFLSTGTNPGTGGLVLDTNSMIIGTSAERLFAGAIGSGGFATTGRISADGAGRLFAGPAAGMATVPIGTYTVNSDCTVSVSLRAENGVGANLTGVIVNQGLEVNLLQNAMVGVVPPGTVTTNVTATPTFLTLTRQAAGNVCSNAYMQGGYGAVFSGYAVSPPGTVSTMTVTAVSPPGTVSTMTVTAVSFVGRMAADGLGHFSLDPVGSQYPSSQIMGSYTIQPDCSGTAQLIFPAGSGMSGTPPGGSGGTQTGTVTRGMQFVILNNGKDLRFAFSDTNMVGTGFATQQ